MPKKVFGTVTVYSYLSSGEEAAFWHGERNSVGPAGAVRQ